MHKIKIHSPRNLIRLMMLIGITRSLSLPFYIWKNKHLKTVLKFLKNGKILHVDGEWVAKFGKQKILLNLLKGDDFFLLENLNTFELSGSIITIGDSKDIVIKNDMRTIHFRSYDVVRAMAESFIDYKDLNVKERFVIDIGAFLGDSIFYFWSRGAKKILAFEPFQDFYERAKSNILLNNLNNEIIIINCGMGSQIYQYDSNKDSSLQENLMSFEEIKKILEKYNEERLPIALKVDCEGCEYEIFKNNEVVRNWKSLGVVEFIMEYHEGDLSSLIKNFEKEGFIVILKIKKTETIGIIHGYLK